MDLDSLRMFVLIAQEGSFQGASEAGGNSRSTLRRKVEELEAHVGAELIRRGPSGIELTEAGAVLAARGAEILAETEALFTTAREVALRPSRPIRLALPPGPPIPAWIQLVPLLRSALPGLRLDAVTHPPTGMPAPRDFDIVITFRRDTPPGYRAFKLAEVDVCLLATPTYLASHPPIRDSNDLSDHTLLCWREAATDHVATLVCKTGDNIIVEPHVLSDDMLALHELAAAGLGIAYVPHRDFVDGTNTFVRVLPDEIGTRRPVRLLVSRAVVDSPTVRSFAEFLEDVLHLQQEGADS